MTEDEFLAAVAKFNEFPDESDQRGDGGSYIESSGKIWKYSGTARGVSNLRESGRSMAKCRSPDGSLSSEKRTVPEVPAVHPDR